MGTGSVHGTREAGHASGHEPPAPGISAFVAEEGGYTSLAVATALLVSLCLVFGAATAGWLLGRSSEVQRVADASALAGSNAVASYVTIAQVLDACVLSLGITGVVVAGAGLVLSAVPGLSLVGAQVGEAGAKILQARQRFAERSAEGLGKLEATLPLIVAANSASCVAANSEDGISYVGCALPLPLASGTEFAVGGAEVDPELLEETTDRMGEASDAARDARDAADEALEAGWTADCGDSPYCLW